MKLILRLLLSALGHQAKLRLVGEAKRRGVAAYLHLVQGVRQALLGGLLAFLFLQTTILAGAGALATGLWLWDYDLHSKMQIAFILCLGFFVLSLLLLTALFSQRLWYRATGAEKLVDDLRKDKSDSRAS